MAYDKKVDSAVLDGAMTATANAIREKTGSTEQIVWSETSGFKDSVDKVYEAGRKAEYDAFWKPVISVNYKVSSPIYRFAGKMWTDGTFRPPQKMTLSENCNGAFFANQSTDITPYVEFERISSINEAFRYSNIKRIPALDVSGITLQNTFASSKVETIELLVVSETTKFLSTSFDQAEHLTHLPIEGTIGQKGFNVQWSTKLSKDSILSIINALQDKTSDTSGTEWVITLGAENLAKLTDEEKAIAYNKNWALG